LRTHEKHEGGHASPADEQQQTLAMLLRALKPPAFAAQVRRPRTADISNLIG